MESTRGINKIVTTPSNRIVQMKDLIIYNVAKPGTKNEKWNLNI